MLEKRKDGSSDGPSTSITVAVAILAPIVLLSIVLSIVLIKNYKANKRERHDIEADPNFAPEETALPDYPDIEKQDFEHPLYPPKLASALSLLLDRPGHSRADTIALPYENDASSARSLNLYARMFGVDFNPYNGVSKGSLYNHSSYSKLTLGDSLTADFSEYKKETFNDGSSLGSSENTAIALPQDEVFTRQERPENGGSRLKNEVFASPEEKDHLEIPERNAKRDMDPSPDNFLDIEEDPLLTEEEKEKHRRMKLIYQVYFDRNNSVKKEGRNPGDAFGEVSETLPVDDAKLSPQNTLDLILNDVKQNRMTALTMASSSYSPAQIQRDTIDLGASYTPKTVSLYGPHEQEQNNVQEHPYNAHAQVYDTAHATVHESAQEGPNVYEPVEHRAGYSVNAPEEYQHNLPQRSTSNEYIPDPTYNQNVHNASNQEYPSSKEYQEEVQQGQYQQDPYQQEVQQGQYQQDPYQQALYQHVPYEQGSYQQDPYQQEHYQGDYLYGNQGVNYTPGYHQHDGGYQVSNEYPSFDSNVPPQDITLTPSAPIAPIKPLKPLKKLPTPSELEKVSDFIDFKAERKAPKKMIKVNRPFNPLEHQGSWSPPIGQNGQFESQAPSASAIARNSIAMLNTVGFGTAKKYKPAGTKKAIPNRGVIPGGVTAGQSQKDLRKMLRQENY